MSARSIKANLKRPGSVNKYPRVSLITHTRYRSASNMASGAWPGDCPGCKQWVCAASYAGCAWIFEFGPLAVQGKSNPYLDSMMGGSKGSQDPHPCQHCGGGCPPTLSSQGSSAPMLDILCAPGSKRVHILASNVSCGALPLAHAQAVAPVALCLYADPIAHRPRHADQRHALHRLPFVRLRLPKQVSTFTLRVTAMHAEAT